MGVDRLMSATLKTGAVDSDPTSFLEGLSASFRKDDPLLWDQALQALPYIPVAYSLASIEYQLAYQRGHGGVWQDLSLTLLHDKRPCGVWPLSVSVKDDVVAVTSQGMAVLPPLFVQDMSVKLRKSVTKKCRVFLEKLCKGYKIDQWSSAESFSGTSNGLSEWHMQFMATGAEAELRHELFVDLSLDVEAIKSYFRKSYKPLISSGTRIWKVGIMDQEDSRVWTDFQRLHLQVSGRVTRSPESWDVHHQAIAHGHAMLVYLRNEQGDMVGGGYFNITRDEGVYGVGAYDRTLFDKPLGHVVQYCAIEEMKARGLSWYKIGLRAYPAQSPTAKELSISEFKQGFATHCFPQFIISCAINGKASREP